MTALLALAAKDIVLTPLATLLQPEVEFFPTGELRNRHHEVAAAIAHQALDIPLRHRARTDGAFDGSLVAFAGAAMAIPDQVMG